VNHAADSSEHPSDNNTISDRYRAYDPGGDGPNSDIEGTSTHDHDNLSDNNDTRYCDHSHAANGYNVSDHNRTYDPGGFSNNNNCKLVHDPHRYPDPIHSVHAHTVSSLPCCRILPEGPDLDVPLQSEGLQRACYVSNNAFKDPTGVVEHPKSISTLPFVAASAF
jgi:hypothetical protein